MGGAQHQLSSPSSVHRDAPVQADPAARQGQNRGPLVSSAGDPTPLLMLTVTNRLSRTPPLGAAGQYPSGLFAVKGSCGR